ncbi:MAG TPA: hypothetical protein PKL29_01290 [Methanothrix sp.]|nr:hypothetical protein [Methanothrix sp.]
MDVSFSAWRNSREESLQLKGESFSFLFDRRYTNRLNRMSRVFFEAYVVATKELAAQEDRFPSLSEIDAKMESGAVYAFKDRLMKNTEFFEEVKISGVSYLVPRALKFVDVTGIYTDLILNFEEGTVALPTRRKTAIPPENVTASTSAAITLPENDETDAKATEENEEEVDNASGAPVDLGGRNAEAAKPQSYPGHVAEAFEEIPLMEEDARTVSTMASQSEAPSSPSMSPSETRYTQQSEHASKPNETPVPKPAERAATGISGPAKEAEKPHDAAKKTAIPLKAVGLLAAAAILVALIVIVFSGTPPGEPIIVDYSAYISNSSNESYLGLDITNPHEMASDMEMSLPANIDKSISARGGIVTISHGDNTLVRMNSSSDASVKIYLLGNWTTIPIGLSFVSPPEFDTGLQVHGKDYYVTRKNDTLILMFNLTGEGVSFEQSYTRKS